jgi:methyltransferase-like protein 6
VGGERELKVLNMAVSHPPYEPQAARNWDKFYERNSTHFFKDRHWVTREFPELLRTDSGAADVCSRSALRYVLQADMGHAAQGTAPPTVLEVGCGVGNLIFPLLKVNPAVRMYACDFSRRAVQLVKVAKPLPRPRPARAGH